MGECNLGKGCPKDHVDLHSLTATEAGELVNRSNAPPSVAVKLTEAIQSKGHLFKK